MTISQEMRDLAQRLLAYEAAADKGYRPMEPAALRTYEKLRQCLVAFAGVASFQSIAARALVLAQVEVPSLCVMQVSAEGTLQRLVDIEPRTTMDKNHTGNQKLGEDLLGEEGVILIGRILGLLLIFLGEALTLSLLRSAWPDVNFDDRNSGNGRIA
jgi:hypothetical protein